MIMLFFFTGSQKKIKATEATRLRKRLAKEIKILRDEIKEYREILKEVESGDRRRMHQVLQADKNIQLAYQDRNPIVGYVFGNYSGLQSRLFMENKIFQISQKFSV